MTTASAPRCCSSLTRASPELKATVVGFRAPCLFFRKMGEQFKLDELVPEGLCPDLFFHLYPQYLSLLYGGNPGGGGVARVRCSGTVGMPHGGSPEGGGIAQVACSGTDGLPPGRSPEGGGGIAQVACSGNVGLSHGASPDGDPGIARVTCPGSSGRTFWRMRAERLPLSRIINLAERFFRLLGRPKDLVDKAIVLVLERAEGSCPMGYSGRVTFRLNQYSHLWKRRFFCPALFYSAYPFLAGDPSPGEPKTRVQCPADNSAIVIEIDPGPTSRATGLGG